ncbi:hypothetical protein MTX78_22065 [Hymenobacter tibetensis]|uniref:DUF2946 domain-containing protein n=1 Tax=Hymenobacter tibetensis TaxID=497967 RepID=A0ABY4D021_9BACT|nr:DUF6660 family protein [Hymenobacter tibetensis]UOG74790.1 hypothetical protein MTX78_22065 [Hymenobacter tibetensis]
MRLLALLFSLYFLVLSCQACADDAGCAASVETYATAGPASHSPKGVADDDWCSPLCQCHCCPGFALPAPQLAPVMVTPLVAASPAYAATPVPAMPAGLRAVLWQPPQLAG